MDPSGIRTNGELAAALAGGPSVTPVANLPIDILERVFQICVAWLYQYQPPKHRLGWTQVCRAWRDTSLNSPRLWHIIDLCNHHLTEEFLIRSQSAPLSIIAARSQKLNDDCLLGHAERIHSIDVYLFPEDMMKLFANIGSKLFNLINLTLRLPPMSPNVCLDIAIPSVRRLNLESVSVRWESCQNLLLFSFRKLLQPFSPSNEDLHLILSKSPQLEYIRIENYEPTELCNRLYPILALPHLQEVTVSASSTTISTIFSYLHLHVATMLRLFTPLTEDLHTLFPQTFAYPHQPLSNATGLRIARHSAYFLSPESFPWLNASSHMPLSISSSKFLGVPVLNSIPHIVNLSNFTTLELSTGILFDIPRDTLRYVLGIASRLESLRIAFNELRDLLGLLTPEESQVVLCPALSTISFNKPFDSWWNFADDWIEPIIDCSVRRRVHSAPLRRLEFHGCHGMTEEIKKRLEEVVPETVIKSF